MNLVVQDELQPGVVLDALLSCANQDINQLRIAVAYTTVGGLELLLPQWRQRIGDGWDAIPKTLLTSIDYGLTEPEALTRWAQQPNASVRIANSQLLAQNHLRPARAFHPKVYLLDHGANQSCVVGSANLTRRAFTVNSEIVAVARGVAGILAQPEWDGIAGTTTPVNEGLLQQYAALRAAQPPNQPDDPPALIQVQPDDQPIFPEAVDAGHLDPAAFERFWVEAGSMSTGGSRNILEVPRYANRFFGLAFANYADAHIVIGHPVLTLGPHQWNDRQLTWHGAPGMNKMERLTLPTAAQGGPPYANTAVLFRRHPGGFELEAADWDSPVAVAWRNASAQAGHLYRLGRGPRLCGLL